MGERWALLILRELIFGPRRFKDLRARLPGISANTLTLRLQSLEEAGLLRHVTLPPPLSTQAYALTAWGREVEPVLMALGRWAARSPAHDPTLPLSAASLLLSFRTMLDPALAEGITATIGLLLDGEGYLARLADGGITVEAGVAETAEAVLAGAPAAIAAVVYGGQRLAAAEEAGSVTVQGDRALAGWFVTLFPLPPKAEA